MKKEKSIAAIILLLIMLGPSIKEARSQQVTSTSSREEADNNGVNALTVTAFSSGGRLRFTSPSSVVQIRLEVYNSAGKKVFDNEVRGGNVLDWHLQDGQAEPIAAADYLCVVTVKSIAGKLAQKVASVSLEKGMATLKTIDISQVTQQQTEAIGPLEENSSISLLREEDDNQMATAIAHNGDEGQLIRGRGALTFRIGDFFRGKDQEQMRLTAEGNLGIGIIDPKARLDVSGLIRTGQGIVFPDGSVQFSAARRTLGATSFAPVESEGGEIAARGERATIEPNIAGSGTTGRIAKWQDGPNGVLSDSVITEFNGSIGINGAPNPIFKLDVTGHNRFRGSNVSFYLTGTKATGNEWLFQTIDADGRLRVFDNTVGAERLSLTQSGNIGIGTASPVRPLEIATGKLRFSNNLGDVEFTEVADLIAHATEANPVPSEPAFRVDTGANLTRVFTVLNDGRVGIGTTTIASDTKVNVVGPATGLGILSTGKTGVNGHGTNYGVYGFNSMGGIGLAGQNNSGGIGVQGIGGNYGVFANSPSGTGLLATSVTGLAGRFNGDVQISGNLSKGGGSFKIDHPLDPENKYLYHSFVESPDMKNIYDGVVLLDANGEAVLRLPEWFGALNRDFRYQLTCIGSFAPVYVAEEMKGNSFKIAGGEPGMKISWQVTGIRQDAYANAHRIKVEEDKPDNERGYFLHPLVLKQSGERGIEWARDPELMQRLKETRAKQIDDLKKSQSNQP